MMKKSQPTTAAAPGFTLIEMMIVIAVLGILVTLLWFPLIRYSELYENIRAEADMAQQARTALQWLGQDLRSANAVLPAAGTYTTAANGTIALALENGNTAQEIVWSSQNGELVRLELDPQSHQVLRQTTLATSQTALQLTLTPAPPQTARVNVRLDCQQTVNQHLRRFSLTGQFRLRRIP